MLFFRKHRRCTSHEISYHSHFISRLFIIIPLFHAVPLLSDLNAILSQNLYLYFAFKKQSLIITYEVLTGCHISSERTCSLSLSIDNLRHFTVTTIEPIQLWWSTTPNIPAPSNPASKEDPTTRTFATNPNPNLFEYNLHPLLCLTLRIAALHTAEDLPLLCDSHDSFLYVVAGPEHF